MYFDTLILCLWRAILFQWLLLVKFLIPDYPGPSKDPNMKVRLMRGKILI